MPLRLPAAVWALLALFIAYRSAGTWSATGPGRPTLISQALLQAWLTLVAAPCLAHLRTPTAVAGAAVAAAGVAFIVDAGQLAMGAPSIGPAGVGSQIAGVVAGGAAFTLRRPR